MDRRIVFETIHNMRDLGGIRVHVPPYAQPDAGKAERKTAGNGGKVIRSGMLFRSAFLFRASEKDLAAMRDDLHIRKVVDLRTDQEIERMPDTGAEGIFNIHRPLINESMMGITHEIRSMTEERSIFIPDMPDMYRQIVSDEKARRNLGKAVMEIMNNDYDHGGVVWHCTEGKDRCGITTAIVLLSLGADRSSVMEDYLITNETNAAKAEGYYRNMMAKGEAERLAAFVRDAFLAKEEYLNAALDAVFEEYGCIEDYLEAALGIREETLERFRDTVLVKERITSGTGDQNAADADQSAIT